MTANAKAPGALGFKALCPFCRNPFIDVRSDGEVFRWTEHPYPSEHWAKNQSCPMSGSRWEPLS